jgi:hypothetical protein
MISMPITAATTMMVAVVVLAGHDVRAGIPGSRVGPELV